MQRHICATNFTIDDFDIYDRSDGTNNDNNIQRVSGEAKTVLLW